MQLQFENNKISFDL